MDQRTLITLIGPNPTPLSDCSDAGAIVIPPNENRANHSLEKLLNRLLAEGDIVLGGAYGSIVQ